MVWGGNMDEKLIQKINETKFILGVTGSIGCGKTYACNLLIQSAIKQKINTNYINIDYIRRNILSTEENYSEVRKKLVNIFGENIENKDSSISRTKINNIIFYDNEAMSKFKTITYPYIKTEVNNQIKNGFNLIEWALLVEDEFISLIDKTVLVVTCNYQTQLNRIKDKEIQKRINLQLSNQEKIEELKKQNKIIYQFDTTNNPSKKSYDNLFEKIMGDYYG
jgi:dephospho-CoA kinase